jgi:hypothetical protein
MLYQIGLKPIMDVAIMQKNCNMHELFPRCYLTRVNLANVVDEGLRIGGRGRQMNSKVKTSQTRRDFVCIENKRGAQLAQSQYVLGRPLLAPLYR